MGWEPREHDYEDVRDVVTRLRVKNGTTYYTVRRWQTYNRHHVVAYRVWGKPLHKDEVGAMYGAEPYCGGAYFSKDPALCEVGESFTIEIMGCD